MPNSKFIAIGGACALIGFLFCLRNTPYEADYVALPANVHMKYSSTMAQHLSPRDTIQLAIVVTTDTLISKVYPYSIRIRDTLEVPAMSEVRFHAKIVNDSSTLIFKADTIANIAEVDFAVVELNMALVAAPPTFAAAAMRDTAILGQAYRDTLMHSGPPGVSRRCTLLLGPSGMTMTNDAVFWVASDSQDQSVLSVVTDEFGRADTLGWTIKITIPDPGIPAVMIISPTSTITHTTYADSVSFFGTAHDNDVVTSVTYILSGATSGSGIATGTTNWSISRVRLDSGQTKVVVTAQDSFGNPGKDSILITKRINHRPEFLGIPEDTVWVGLENKHALIVKDIDGDSLSFEIMDGPTALILDPINRFLSWSPTIRDTGFHGIAVRTHDGHEGRDTLIWLVHVRVWGDGSVKGYYPFNGNANDVSGFGNHGIIHDAKPEGDRFGSTNAAYGFDGYDDYLVVPENQDMEFGNNSFSLCFWLKKTGPTRNGTHGVVLNREERNQAQNGGYAVDLYSSGELKFRIRDNANQVDEISSITPLIDNQWYSVVCEYTVDSLAIHVNGFLHGRKASNRNLDSVSTKLYIGGGSGDLGNYCINGVIDDIQFFNRALDSAEIDSLYHLGGWTAGAGDTVRDLIPFLMPEANIVVRGTFPLGSRCETARLLEDSNISAAPGVSGYVVWEKPLSHFNHPPEAGHSMDPFPPNVDMVFAVNAKGFYFGAVGQTPHVLSTIGTFYGHGIELRGGPQGGIFRADSGVFEARDIALVGIGHTEIINLLNYGYLRGVSRNLHDFKNSVSMEVRHTFEKDLFVAYYPIFIPGESEFEDLSNMTAITRWCQFANSKDNGQAMRQCRIDYNGQISSFVYASCYNNNSENSSITLDGTKVVEQTNWGLRPRKTYDVFPRHLILNATKTWSVVMPALSVTVVADSITVRDWTETPSLGERRNPPPDLVVFEPGKWTHGNAR